jgi:NAD(P)-dependent dehydrogenase (short-subunit alcohol dehydrogenase family)
MSWHSTGGYDPDATANRSTWQVATDSYIKTIMPTSLGMKSVVLITGASSGIGLATALQFARKGWNVAATVRNPESASQELLADGLIRVYRLDVTNEESIRKALADVLQDFGRLDVVVNNAGYGAVGIFEKATPEQIRRQFDTNVLGAMSVIRTVLPHFRQQHSGTFINITSMGGLITFPLYSVYHGTKWALEGFSESLQYELRPVGIRVKCIEPGVIKTDFYSRSQDLFQNEGITDYDDYESAVWKATRQAGEKAEGPEAVAKTIFRAATDGSSRLRYAVGGHAPVLLALRRLLPAALFISIVRGVLERGFRRR